MGSYKIQGLKNASHRGLTTRADHEKRHPPGFFIKGVQRCANQEIGISTTILKRSPLQSQLLRKQFLTERNLISHYVIANSGQLIA
jgi:hypothetical protein